MGCLEGSILGIRESNSKCLAASKITKLCPTKNIFPFYSRPFLLLPSLKPSWGFDRDQPNRVGNPQVIHNKRRDSTLLAQPIKP